MNPDAYDAGCAAAAPLAARRWRPVPAIWISFGLHVVVLVMLAAMPQHWRGLLAILVGNHLTLVAASFFPRGTIIGASLRHLPEDSVRRGEIALTFDDGPDPRVTPQVLDLLGRYGARASFFCVGERAAAHPQLVREIVRRGHSVENHSARHSYLFAARGWWWTRREVATAQAQLTALAGTPPQFFRAPAGFRNPLLDPILARLGLRYVAWTRRGYDSVSGDADRVLRRLTRGLAAGDILLLHDGDPARTRNSVPVVLEVLPALLDKIERQGLRAVSLLEAVGSSKS